ncbi:MAG: polysaccharide deacetylase family protein [Fimbriimonadaceae bacterium]|nr:polysaccharide deacetylase family protein [Fimbriimonadaceae bacterium]QYK57765.1 MAG: polysaccharide deacetylase family protein [Fimbriimonadaceae bacterium]
MSERVPVLMYHRIACRPPGTTVPMHYVAPKRFENHVKVMGRLGFESTTLIRAFQEIDKPGKRVVFTFDDGYGNFLAAARILESSGMVGTVFVVTGQVGGVNEWDMGQGDVREPLLTQEEILALVARGHEIGSHTVSHARLTEVSEEEARRELEDSRRALAHLLGNPPASFCYPYGAHDSKVRGLVAEVGYSVACGTEKGWNDRWTDRTRWRRVNVRGDTTTPVLFWKLWNKSRSRATEA